MRAILMLALILGIPSATTANPPARAIEQGEYFWDTDPGEGLGTPLAALDGTLEDTIEGLLTNGVAAPPTPGAHRLHLRVRDAAGGWSPGFSTLVAVRETPVAATPRPAGVAAAEYFWDTDPGEGLGTPLAALDGTLEDMLEGLLTNGVAAPPTPGAHRLHVRVRDAAGGWSPGFSTMVAVPEPAVATPTPRPAGILAAEYFWDTDPGEGLGTPLAALDGTLEDMIEGLLTNGVAAPPTPGAHRLHVRVRDAAGGWSPGFSTMVAVREAPVAATPRPAGVAAAEYFWDTDPGEGLGTPLAALDGTLEDMIEGLLTNGVAAPPTPGAHRLHVRVRDAAGDWSPGFATMVIVREPAVATPTPRPAGVAAAEYFWDTDPGEGLGTPLAALDGTLGDMLEGLLTNGVAAPLTPGAHRLHVRVRDPAGDWGPDFATMVAVEERSNQPPSALVLQPGDVDENLPASTQVGSFSATDPDENDAFVFSLRPGDGDTDNGRFVIDGANLLLDEPLDAEAASERFIRVRVTDLLGHFAEFPITVSVNDIRTEDADNDGLTEAVEEDELGTSDILADSDGDGFDDGVEFVFGYSPSLFADRPTITLVPGSVVDGAGPGVSAGELGIPSGIFDAAFSLVPGPGATDNAQFELIGSEVFTAVPVTLEQGSNRSIRVRAERTGFAFESVCPLTLIEPGVSTNVLEGRIDSPATGAANGAQCGFRLAADGGLVAVSAPGEDAVPTGTGVVRIKSLATGQVIHRLHAPPSSSLFGHGLDVAGQIVAVGDPTADNSGAGRGRVYIYDLAGPTPTTPVHTLINPVNNSTANFGGSVGISSNLLVVGDDFDSTTGFRSGRAYVYNLAGTNPITVATVLENPIPGSEHRFGDSVAIDGARVVVGAPGDSTGATRAGRAFAYLLTGPTPTVPTHTLAHPTPSISDEMGAAVAISGTRIVVGVPNDDPGAVNAGAALLFDLASVSPLTPRATLLDPAPASSDAFGTAVAISDSRIVVGAAADDTGAAAAGAAFVFTVNGTLTNTLQNPSPDSFDEFGVAVALAGTVAIVGAWLDDTLGEDEGAVYRYDLAGANPATPSMLNASRPSVDSSFGMRVAMRDGLLAVGAPDDSSVMEFGGRVYLYDTPHALTNGPLHILENPTPQPAINFGRSLGVSSNHVVVGADGDDTGAVNAGRVFVYELDGATPTAPSLVLTNPTPALGDSFGRSVATSGRRVVVGTPLDDTFASNSGAVYVYTTTNGATAPLAIFNPTPAANDQFGTAVALEGSRLLVGAPNDGLGAAGAGAVYEYDLSRAVNPHLPVRTIANPAAVASDAFGTAVALSGSRAVIGATGKDTGALNAGAAYVYTYTTGGVALAHALLNPQPVSNDNFGSAVAISGRRVVIGVANNDTGGTSAGTAYSFDMLSQTPHVPEANLVNPTPAPNDSFGIAVAVDDKLATIGAPGDDGSGPDRGSVYLFRLWADPLIAVTAPDGTEVTHGQALPVDVGEVAPGSATNGTFTIRNVGQGPLTIVGIASVPASGTGNTVFTVASPPAITLIPGESTVFELTFTPIAPGPSMATLRIHSNAANTSPFNIPVTGAAVTTTSSTSTTTSTTTSSSSTTSTTSSTTTTAAHAGLHIAILGTNAALIVSEDATPEVSDGTDFGSVDENTDRVTHTFTIHNGGSSNLVVTQLAVGGADPEAFSYPPAAHEPLPWTITPGNAHNLVVRFMPTRPGTKTARIVVRSNAVNAPRYAFAVRGIQLHTYGDSDLDGMNDFEEEIAGTDPLDAGSFYPPLAIVPTNNPLMTVITIPQTSTGRVYDIFSATNLLDPEWAGSDQGSFGTGSNLVLIRTNDAPRRFDRTGVNEP